MLRYIDLCSLGRKKSLAHTAPVEASQCIIDMNIMVIYLKMEAVVTAVDNLTIAVICHGGKAKCGRESLISSIFTSPTKPPRTSKRILQALGWCKLS